MSSLTARAMGAAFYALVLVAGLAMVLTAA